MNTPKMYLKPNVVLEPLVDKWYAWSHLDLPGHSGDEYCEPSPYHH